MSSTERHRVILAERHRVPIFSRENQKVILSLPQQHESGAKQITHSLLLVLYLVLRATLGFFQKKLKKFFLTPKLPSKKLHNTILPIFPKLPIVKQKTM